MFGPYDAFLLVSFGGPEGPDDVMPFLENVLRGKPVPRERMLEVAEHYHQFGGISPINEQNRQLISALETEFAQHGIDLPIYWGNRNWHPMLPDTMRQMALDGRKRVLAFFTSAYSSYSGCRQYRENIASAQAQVGPIAPRVDRIRMFFNHPGFIEVTSQNVANALQEIPAGRHATTQLVFTAHSIPMSMAENCEYVNQLRETSRLVAAEIGHSNWQLVYQSRSGPPSQPWLEPDVCDHLRELKAAGKATDVVVAPIGFVSDHLEVLYDLDTEAKDVCAEIGLGMVRAATPGNDPRYISMVRELVAERRSTEGPRPVVGELAPCHDTCPEDCCTYTPRRPGQPGKASEAPTG